MRKGKRPVVLVVDEAHDLHHKTLTGLKRLMEVVADAGVLLSVLLVGHPRLRNDLRRPQMEEIGYRTTTFDYEGIGAERRDYVAWLLGACAADGDGEEHVYLVGTITKTSLTEHGDIHRWLAPAQIRRAIHILASPSAPLRALSGKRNLWPHQAGRSEERRAGKEWVSAGRDRWWPVS